jgi:hypothetical protein
LILVEATADREDRSTADQVLLFMQDGRLQCLEYVCIDDQPPMKWPHESRIRPSPMGAYQSG